MKRISTDPTAALGRYDQALRRRLGIARLGGLDEAGRGALAGPVVVGCVVLEPGARLSGVHDSKQLDPARREELAARIIERAADWTLGWATAAEVDRHNVLQATLRAAGRALSALREPPEYLLTDFLHPPAPPCHYEALKKGDATSRAVAAASILAKVARDRIMKALDAEYPQYGFARHKGYGTPDHWAAIDTHGPSTLHRLTYRGVCFFHAEATVRSRTRIQFSDFGVMPSAPNLTGVLSAAAEQLNPAHFLPEAEWER